MPWLDPSCPEMPSASKIQHSKTWVSPLPLFKGDSSPNVCGSDRHPSCSHPRGWARLSHGPLCARVPTIYLRASVPCGSLFPQLPPPSSEWNKNPIHAWAGTSKEALTPSLSAGWSLTFNFFGKLYPLGICQRFLLFFNTFKIQNFTNKLNHWLCLVKCCCRYCVQEKQETDKNI